MCVCVGGGGGGGERERESLREFCTLTCNPICKHTTHCSEVTETGRSEASHECEMCMDDVSYIIPK